MQEAPPSYASVMLLCLIFFQMYDYVTYVCFYRQNMVKYPLKDKYDIATRKMQWQPPATRFHATIRPVAGPSRATSLTVRSS